MALEGSRLYEAPRILVCLQGLVLEALLDSGATRSFLKKPLPGGKMTPSTVHVRVADGSIIKARQAENVEVKLGSLQTRHEFQIIPDLPEDCIIGIDFMTMYDLRPSYKNNCVTIGDSLNEVPFTKSTKSNSVKCSQRTTIPARGQQWVKVTSDVTPGKNYLMEGVLEVEQAKKLLIARTFSESPPDCLLVMNTSEDDRVINAGSILATCEEAERIKGICSTI